MDPEPTSFSKTLNKPLNLSESEVSHLQNGDYNALPSSVIVEITFDDVSGCSL